MRKYRTEAKGWRVDGHQPGQGLQACARFPSDAVFHRIGEVMFMEFISLKEVPIDAKVALLKELGYGADKVYVLDDQGKPLKDKYIDIPVKLDNMLILPGSSVVIDNNPLSIVNYLEEFGEIP
jgi:hypothetical protein